MTTPGGLTAVGIGARAGVRAAAVRALLARVVAEHGLDPSALVYATVEARVDELRDVLDGARLVVWSAAELAAVPVPHPSARVAAAAGTPSVAEAAALLTARWFACGAPGPAVDGPVASRAAGPTPPGTPPAGGGAGSGPVVVEAELVVPKTAGDGVTVAVARARR